MFMVSSVICHIALPLYPEQRGIGKQLLQRSQCPLVSLGVVELSCNVSFINESTSNPWGLSPIYLHVSHAIPLPQ